ncbi:lactonase family protein [Bacteroides zoogleoformans]|uniref:6-phosphogluconolactonase n=1 Tax=Bacteroides zoogleoformans TaxID=28119 RepID=A0ABM6T9U5_9BACE|nr:lactonase family protein [Bacteroides zoogleoformans]AVM53533.1 6-phosphogluconolactonase [Bacteroides zoogleoformans]
MKTFLFCMLGLSITACTPKKASNNNQDELAMLVGTYTNGTSKGIYTFRFNQETGRATLLDSVELDNPSYLTPSEDGKLVYAVSEMNDNTAALNTLSFDKETGSMHLLSTELTLGGDPCYVATNGSKVLTANYSGGNMSVFSLLKDGRPAPVDTLFEGAATGSDPIRQGTPHIHCAVFSPDGKYVFATDFSADRILRFVLHPNAATPHPSMKATDIESGSGPRHLTFSPNGKYAYLITELSGKVIAFSYDDGRLNQIQTITADTMAARGSADIHLSPDGKYLYASNRLKGDGIAIFSVNPQNGNLAKVGYQQTGIHPRNFNITPNGKFLLVACRDSNIIQVFQRDEHSGLLSNTHQDIILDKPVCIQFIHSVNNP